MLLGYQDASSRYDVILIAETITKESIHPFALTLFKYNIEVPSIHATVDKLEPLFSNGHDEDSYTNVEIVADRIVGFQENDFQTLKLELLSQDLLETRKANYCLKSAISQKKKILNAIENIGKRDSVIKDSITSTRWSDIGGYSKAKQLLEQSVIWYYKYADSFRSLNLTPSKGTILYGPPGCGKTMLAKSVAVESGAAFLPVSVPSLIKGEIGESEKAIANLFAEARSMSPCIVFLDEIDSIFSNRVGMGDLALKLYAQLVAELDLIGNDLSQIMILATTNHIEQIDPGLLRSGRLDRIIHISLPTYTDRKDILRVIFAASKIRIDFSFEHIAELMEGMSGSDIYECIRRATLVAMEGKVACDTILLTEANIVDELERS
ncbi:P-loop containing nucleoside triphosphate hydrolase protein [Globomyces pollinis-pini]|nr:P-loop containing nucleoside triphosphate hydrolase protein [Globomyces pollinis-pini]